MVKTVLNYLELLHLSNKLTLNKPRTSLNEKNVSRDKHGKNTCEKL